MSQDLEQLRLLSIFHYVLGGMVALFACLPLIHFFLGLAFASGWLEGGESAPRLVGCGLMAVAACFILAGWTLAICLLFAGSFLAKRRHYTFCQVVAAVSCIFMPLGTVLGVFTLVVLTRASVRALFSPAQGSTAPP